MSLDQDDQDDDGKDCKGDQFNDEDDLNGEYPNLDDDKKIIWMVNGQ